MAKIQIKSEKLTPFGGIFSGHGAIWLHIVFCKNTVFLLTALIRNFYKTFIQRLGVKRFGLNATSRIKAFVFRFVSVPAKWIRTSRQYVLNIYTCNNAYADVFQTDFEWRLQLMGMILRIVSSRIVGVRGDFIQPQFIW